VRSSLVLALAFGCSHDAELDDIAHERERACRASFAPAPDVLYGADDADALQPGLQVSLTLSIHGADCAAVSWGTCAPDASYQRPTQETRRPLAGSDTALREQLPITVDQPGKFGFCATVEDGGSGVVLYRSLTYALCGAGEVFCSDARSCYADVASNPDHCGERCERCAASGELVATCNAGQCGQRCQALEQHLDPEGCVRRPGCSGLAAACYGDDCCAVDEIPTDRSPIHYIRGHDATNVAIAGECLPAWQPENAAAVVVSPFALDRYEVTVARFRAFLAEYDAWIAGKSNPKPGAGLHPASASSGWQATWSSGSVADAVLGTAGTPREIPVLPPSAADFAQRISACAPSSFTAQDGALRAMNCVNFYEAMLFCIWDGNARLPTEAEWNAAAAGGEEQRAYPWSKPAQDSSWCADCARTDQADNSLPFPVGMFAAGAARWNSRDLAGNVWEWVRDTGSRDTQDTYIMSAMDPLELVADELTETRHRLRGGSFKKVNPAMCDSKLSLRTAARVLMAPSVRLNDVGFRCARKASL
jgi:formylglycine-generating enzyme required for sulfatase activity